MFSLLGFTLLVFPSMSVLLLSLISCGKSRPSRRLEMHSVSHSHDVTGSSSSDSSKLLENVYVTPAKSKVVRSRKEIRSS
ncbi:hypothetical protein OESDEN_21592 [Oesophagostomum dentatum]|uniref:Secreted protein n=1 Tax=Oesophagostomum dentatum TaxID=61180 RepID=A0A0B1S1G7_OESDE|nr:hypothetical protein OESDEN_21592 [Oesophagostomum dentatum]